ncbi:Nudix hydrolase 3 [Morella rubra]|uniref:Nudix hydrolase 3 n=1 Tax=Morella rubra TaxID=262757 RepID=A0A6A1UF67_9ROSI|nr:Nudix hydrolase 3 [Morella rubra]
MERVYKSENVTAAPIRVIQLLYNAWFGNLLCKQMQHFQTTSLILNAHHSSFLSPWETAVRLIPYKCQPWTTSGEGILSLPVFNHLKELPRFKHILQPIADVCIAKEQQEPVDFESFFTHTIFHECCHGIGPHTITLPNGQNSTVRLIRDLIVILSTQLRSHLHQPRLWPNPPPLATVNFFKLCPQEEPPSDFVWYYPSTQELQELHSALEEAKADIVGLWALRFLIHQDLLPKGLLKSMYVSFLAGCFRSVRFGLQEAHGKGQALHFNWLYDKGAFLMHPDETFSVDFSKVEGAVESLSREILTIQAKGDKEAANLLLQKYSKMMPPLMGALQKLEDIQALGAGSISTPQPNPQTLPGASVATGPALPQHLAVHPYSQPSLPLGHFANMIGYPFLPQSYTYMPSAFQQAFAGNSNYHQSLAAVLPQYKNSVSVSSLPQSAAIASGYAFGSSTSIPGGNFPLNQPSAPTGTTVGYDDVISSQYKDSNHLISLQQQNDNSAMWVHGPGSRTVSALPSTYYGFQGQNQQPSGYRQGQQPSQHFGALGYPNFYHSQTGLSMEHQQQNQRDAALGGSQGQASKQSQQIWQNSY